MSNNEDRAKQEMTKVSETKEVPKQSKLSIDINSPTPIQCILDKEQKGFVLKDKLHTTKWMKQNQ
jgi:hypothetical protein